MGCAADEGGDDLEDFDNERIVVLDNEVNSVKLIAGKRADAGTVSVTIDNSVDTSDVCGEGATGVMNVTYETTGPWELVLARMAVGKGLEEIPTNCRGRVKKNQFAHNSGDITGATTHTFAVPLCELGLDGADESCEPVKPHIVAHARVRKLKKNGSYRYKGAWADGEALGRRRRWGKFFTMELSCTEDTTPPPPPVAECETAFAAGPYATCFLGADFDGDGVDDGHANWGFTNGAIAPNTSTSWPVYAAIGGCDPSNGTHVGDLAVSYDGATATVVFDRVGDVTLDEEQLYIGDEVLPRDVNGDLTITPADFPIAVDLDGATQTTHTVTGLSGDIHLAYHAVACGEGLAPSPDPLASLTDEFLVDGDLSDWDLYRPDDASVTADDGALVIQPYANTQWYATDQALHVNKTITGDFAVSAHIEVGNVNNGGLAPNSQYQIGGLMIRDPGSVNLPNTFHMGIGNMASPDTVVTVSKSTDEGVSEIGTQDWNGLEAEMRLCRVGAEVQAFIRFPDQPWHMVDSRQRPDLPATVAVGAIGYAGTPTPDIRVSSDWIQYQTVSTIEDCWRD